MSRDNDSAQAGALGEVASGTNAGQEGLGEAVPPAPGVPTQQPGMPAGPAESAGEAPGPGVGEGSVGEAPGRTTTRGGGDGDSGGGWLSRLLRLFGLR